MARCGLQWFAFAVARGAAVLVNKNIRRHSRRRAPSRILPSTRRQNGAPARAPQAPSVKVVKTVDALGPPPHPVKCPSKPGRPSGPYYPPLVPGPPCISFIMRQLESALFGLRVLWVQDHRAYPDLPGRRTYVSARVCMQGPRTPPISPLLLLPSCISSLTSDFFALGLSFTLLTWS